MDALECSVSNQWQWFNCIKTTCLCWDLCVSLSLNDELFKQVKASESPRSISILASSSVSGVTASWGQRDYWDQASPSSMPLAQPGEPTQSVPQAPPVPYRAAHQAHREQRGTRDPSNCPCFGQLSGKPAWRRPPVPRLSHCSPLSPHS